MSCCSNNTSIPGTCVWTRCDAACAPCAWPCSHTMYTSRAHLAPSSCFHSQSLPRLNTITTSVSNPNSCAFVSREVWGPVLLGTSCYNVGRNIPATYACNQCDTGHAAFVLQNNYKSNTSKDHQDLSSCSHSESFLLPYLNRTKPYHILLFVFSFDMHMSGFTGRS